MKHSRLFLLLLAAALPSLLAAPFEETDYLTIVPVAGPSANVVTAANFAAAMKREAGVTFSGVTDEQLLRSFDEFKLDEKTVVVIDGESVRLVKGERTGPEHGVVAQKAYAYFRSLGYDVRLRLDESLSRDELGTPRVVKEEGGEERGGEGASDDAVAEAPPAEPSCDGCAYEGECLPEGAVVGGRFCDGRQLLPRKGEGEPCRSTSECATGECVKGACTAPPAPTPAANGEGEEAGEGIFSRIINWFKSLFS